MVYGVLCAMIPGQQWMQLWPADSLVTQPMVRNIPHIPPSIGNVVSNPIQLYMSQFNE